MEESAIEAPLTAIEVEVVEFMEILRLSRLQADPAPTRRLAFSWGNKRRRSAIDRSPSPPPPPAQKVKLDAASSPPTTLAFPPSESEGKLDNPITTSNLPKIENLHKLCDSLSSQNQSLLEEIAKVRSYFDKLKKEQFHLKERLRVEKEKQQVCLELEPPATAIRLNLSISNQVPYIVHHHHHHQPLVVDQAGVECTSVAKGGLFDLNVLPVEEAAAAPVRWLGMAAQARLNRKKRKEKIQQRNNECATKFRVVR